MQPTAIATTAAALGFASVAAENNQSPPSRPASTFVAASVRPAAQANTCLLAFFQEEDYDATRAARRTCGEAVTKPTPAAESVVVDRPVPEAMEFVAKLASDRTLMPFAPAFAPNDAVTAGCKGAETSEERVRDAMAIRGWQSCLEALQALRLVNGRIQSNGSAPPSPPTGPVVVPLRGNGIT